MRRVLGLACAIVCLCVSVAQAAEESLEQQLKQLDVGNQAPKLVTKEKLYVIQDRNLPLKYKSEVSAGEAMNLTGNSFLNTYQFELGYRFHLSDRFSLATEYAWVANSFSSSANQLITSTTGIIPDAPYARTRADLVGTYNMFYGKFRLSMEQVFYFDQYVSLGGGVVDLNTGTMGSAVADAGFVFWLGKWGSARLGLKDYVYTEPRKSGAVLSHNLHGHVNLGYIF